MFRSLPINVLLKLLTVSTASHRVFPAHSELRVFGLTQVLLALSSRDTGLRTGPYLHDFAKGCLALFDRSSKFLSFFSCLSLFLFELILLSLGLRYFNLVLLLKLLVVAPSCADEAT